MISKAIALAGACAILQGCIAPTALKIEAEHVSHPTVGDVLSNRFDEDGLTQANALAVWRFDSVYLEAGLGQNLKGKHGGGFYGPSLTGTIRAGVEFKLRKGQ